MRREGIDGGAADMPDVPGTFDLTEALAVLERTPAGIARLAGGPAG